MKPDGPLFWQSKQVLAIQANKMSNKILILDKTSFNVKFFDWNYLHLTALTKETYFIMQPFKHAQEPAT
jgi:hypothetical protein